MLRIDPYFPEVSAAQDLRRGFRDLAGDTGPRQSFCRVLSSRQTLIETDHFSIPSPN